MGESDPCADDVRVQQNTDGVDEFILILYCSAMVQLAKGINTTNETPKGRSKLTLDRSVAETE